MKITVLTTLVLPRWLFLKVETDEAGLTGWGEPVVEGRAETVAACVAELADYLIGKEAGAIEDHWTVLYRGGFYRGGAIHMSALAGIDQALWDIKGKALGQPVHAPLGGSVRRKMRVYRAGLAVATRPQGLVKGRARGGRAGLFRRAMSATEVNMPLSTIRPSWTKAATRRRGARGDGPGLCGIIAVDFHGWPHWPMAKLLASQYEPFKPMVHRGTRLLSEYVEALKRDQELHRDAHRRFGERLFSRWDFKACRAPQHDGLADIIQLDLPCRRHHRDQKDRRCMAEAYDARGGAALSAGPSIALAAQPRSLDARSATMPRSRNRAWASITTRLATRFDYIDDPGVFAYADGPCRDPPDGPGLQAIPLDEDARTARRGHRPSLAPAGAAA